MATILDFEAFREDVLPSHWVDIGARTRSSPAVRGWLRDLAGIAEVLFADEIGPPDRARIRWVCEQTRDFTETVGGKSELVFRLGVFATNWVAPVMVAKLPPLWRLQYPDRVRALKRYESSPLGLSLFAVKVFLGISWFEHPDVAREVHFDAACRGERS